MSQVAQIVRMERIRPVKWSAIEKAAGSPRRGLVAVFLKYEGRPLLDEDGTPIVNARGTPVEVKVRSFARRLGINERTFQDWVFDVRGVKVPGNQRHRADSARSDEPEVESSDTEEDDHGRCHHCPEHPDFSEGR